MSYESSYEAGYFKSSNLCTILTKLKLVSVEIRELLTFYVVLKLALFF